MRAKVYSLVTAFTLLLAALPLAGHHSFSSEFDAKKEINVRGTVTKMEWINPHTWIHLDVKKSDGATEKWMIEAGTPNSLLRRGFTKKSLLPGTEVIVNGYQSKDGALRANGRDMTLPNGDTLFLGSSGTGAPYDKDPRSK